MKIVTSHYAMVYMVGAEDHRTIHVRVRGITILNVLGGEETYSQAFNWTNMGSKMFGKFNTKRLFLPELQVTCKEVTRNGGV